MRTTLNSSGIRIMNNPLKKKLLAAAMATGAVMPVFAYGQTQHAGHTGHADHMPAAPESSVPVEASGMNHGAMDMSGMDHGSMDMSGMDHGSGEMDHGDMQMQGGSAPSDARDPDAYSDGYVRNAGQYALPPSEALIMSDMHNFGSVYFDRLEYVKARGEEWAAYEGEAWYGSTYNRAVIKAEGDVAGGKLQEAETQLLWRHAVSTFWDTELGFRFDHANGAPNREWLAFGFKGLAPYWFEVDATAYVGPSGRTALALEAEYDIRLTQKLYLQPSVELNFHGKDDERWGVGNGLTDGTAGLRVKYEITRQFVPYVGVEWSSKFSKTADYARAAGESRQETRFVTGLSFRF
tara:strand:+ start:4692 stop:5741 length:1050 start_codon:yes stop_codon:yes gene_type:complete